MSIQSIRHYFTESIAHLRFFFNKKERLEAMQEVSLNFTLSIWKMIFRPSSSNSLDFLWNFSCS